MWRGTGERALLEQIAARAGTDSLFWGTKPLIRCYALLWAAIHQGTSPLASGLRQLLRIYWLDRRC